MFSKIATVRIGLVLAAASIFVTAGIISAQTTTTQEQQVRATTNHLLQAINNEDLTAIGKDMDSGAAIDGFGFCPGDKCVGSVAIQAAMKLAVDQNLRLRPVSGTERVLGSIWIAEVELRADSIQQGGAERLLFQLESEVKGDKVVRLRFTPELDDAQTVKFLGIGTPASVPPRPVSPPATGDAGLR